MGENFEPDLPSSLFWQGMEQALARSGISDAQRDRALQRVQARQGVFWGQPFDHVTLETFAATLLQEVGEPHIGLTVGASIPDGSIGLVEFLLLSAPTLRSVADTYARWSTLTGERVRYGFVMRGDEALITFSEAAPGAHSPTAAAIEDYRVARLFCGLRRILAAPSYLPLAAHFTYQQPRTLAIHHRLFGTDLPLEFGSDHPGILVPSAMLDRPLPRSEPVLHRLLARQAELLEQQLRAASSLVAQVRHALRARLPRGRPSLPAVARALHMSDRTLRRRLADEGTSFSRVLDELRAALIDALPHPPDRNRRDTAAHLGFEATNSLRRARQRWSRP